MLSRKDRIVRDNVTIAYRGAKYELGRGSTFFGIWAAGASRSQPLEWWPDTPEGWAAAWSRFTEIETPGTIVPVGGRRATAGRGGFPGGAGAFTSGAGTSTAGAGTFTAGAGTFTAGAGTFTAGAGTFTAGAGTFTAGAGTFEAGQGGIPAG